jgi:hypothetical protein
MRSEIVKKIASDTHRKVDYNVKAYIKFVLSGIKQRFHYYLDWESFNIGVGFCKTTGISGWKYMLSLDLGFFGCWVYFVKNDNFFY